MEKKDWKVWDKNEEYGRVFFKRATGELAEMESSKAAAKYVCSLIAGGETLLDVGCGSGHYLRSVINKLEVPFKYRGVDHTQNYIDLANEAWKQKGADLGMAEDVSFSQGDIFNLQIADASVDVCMCNNVLLHLPSIEKPISELIRVAKKYVLIRTIIGKNTFRIKQCYEPVSFDENGEPDNFNFHNIYSVDYIQRMLKSNSKVESFELVMDKDFDGSNINASTQDYKDTPTNVTTVVNGMQVNDCIIQPWQFLIIKLK